MINRKTVVKKIEGIVTAKLDEKAVMMSIENGRYYGMNDIATVIWDNIEKPISIEKLVQLLTDEFDVSDEQCEDETVAFLTKLYNENIIEIQ